MIPTITEMRPTANVTFPAQSIEVLCGGTTSCSIVYAHTVQNRPMGTETRKISRQLMGASRPPATSPMNVPLVAATPLMPRAIPRWPAGKTSVRMAPELANSIAPPTPWKIRMTIRKMAPGAPVNHVIESTREKKVNRAKPRL